MKRTIIMLVIGLLLTGCTSRKVVIDPNDISKYNSSEWTIKKEPTKDTNGK